MTRKQELVVLKEFAKSEFTQEIKKMANTDSLLRTYQANLKKANDCFLQWEKYEQEYDLNCENEKL